MSSLSKLSNLRHYIRKGEYKDDEDYKAIIDSISSEELSLFLAILSTLIRFSPEENERYINIISYIIYSRSDLVAKSIMCFSNDYFVDVSAGIHSFEKDSGCFKLIDKLIVLKKTHYSSKIREVFDGYMLSLKSEIYNGIVEEQEEQQEVQKNVFYPNLEKMARPLGISVSVCSSDLIKAMLSPDYAESVLFKFSERQKAVVALIHQDCYLGVEVNKDLIEGSHGLLLYVYRSLENVPEVEITVGSIVNSLNLLDVETLVAFDGSDKEIDPLVSEAEMTIMKLYKQEQINNFPACRPYSTRFHTRYASLLYYTLVSESLKRVLGAYIMSVAMIVKKGRPDQGIRIQIVKTESHDSSNFSGNTELFDIMPFEFAFVVAKEFLHRGKTYDMEWFCSNANIRRVDFSNLDTSDCVSMKSMFNGCSKLENIIFPKQFVTEKCDSLECMFYGCESLKSVDLSCFDVKNVTSLERMFFGCSALNVIDIHNFNPSNLKTCKEMFYHCYSLAEVDARSLEANPGVICWGMFDGCSKLEKLNIESFRLKSGGDSSADFFKGCTALKRSGGLKVPNGFPSSLLSG